MEKLGLVASGSKATECFVIFEEQAELKHNIREEDFVVIEDNRTKSKILGIVRSGRGIDPTIKTGTYGIGTAYVSKGKGDLLSSNRMFFDAYIAVLGEIKDGKVSPNRKWITPGSWALLPNKNPFLYFKPESDVIEIGHYRDRKDWKFQLNGKMLNRHVAVFGSTGSGKSHLIRVELIPEILKKTEYSVLVIDYSGEDYAPYFTDVIPVTKLKLCWEAMANKIIEMCRGFGASRWDNTISNSVSYNVKRLYERGTTNFYRDLITLVQDELRQGRSGEANIRKFNMYYEDLDENEINELFNRELEPKDLDKILKEKRMIVIDLSSEEPEGRLAAVESILSYYKSQLKKSETGEGLNLLNRIIVIDEAPQFCPSTRESSPTTKLIMSLLALGRKHNLGLALASQGITGDIGINAAVRRNINTKFVGKVSPNDLRAVSEEIVKSKIDDATITNLQTGEFYVSGLMSPIGQAVLVKIFASEDEKYGRAKGK